MDTDKRILSIGLIALVIIGVGFVLVKREASTPSPAQQLEQYSSEDGVSFMYPSSYRLSSRTEGNGERQWDVLTLTDKSATTPPQDSEGPPAITLGVFPNPENASLEQWVRGTGYSNFKLSPDDALVPTTLGGAPALAYRYSGLYEQDAVAVAHEGKVFLFSAGWLSAEDRIRTDFQNLLASVVFTL